MTSQPAAHLPLPLNESVSQRLQTIYGAVDDRLRDRIVRLAADYGARITPRPRNAWDQTDVVLITYGDQVHAAGEPPLASLARFLETERVDQLLSTIHILPFFPFSSDDGFSVIDFLKVDPALGEWSHVERIGRRFRLMFDLVMNHVSAQGAWFQSYLRGEAPYDRYFIEADPTGDFANVVRPRSLPLLTPAHTNRGVRHVWTTFSADQVDLNYAEPEVLATMLQVLLEYAVRGAQIIRLDAVGFLWKQLGTSCIHLPQTHAVVKLMRDVLAAAAPHVWLLTETNVPHEENVSYFGDGDEAQIVYQFSLPPLLLDAFVHADATYLMRWLASLEPPRAGTTFLNFTASHDGVGVRPLEGLAPEHRLTSLVEAVKRRGGLVSTRRRGGEDVPYELNIAYVDAMSPDDPSDRELHARRFLASQAVMLALQGIPAVYFHSLVGSRNDRSGVEASGQNRRINRRKFQWEQLQRQLDQSDQLPAMIHRGYRRLLAVRRRVAAFHPDASQQAVACGDSRLIAFARQSLDGDQRILTLANTSGEPATVELGAMHADDLTCDLISENTCAEGGVVVLQPGQAVWLAAESVGPS